MLNSIINRLKISKPWRINLKGYYYTKDYEQTARYAKNHIAVRGVNGLSEQSDGEYKNYLQEMANIINNESTTENEIYNRWAKINNIKNICKYSANEFKSYLIIRKRRTISMKMKQIIACTLSLFLINGSAFAEESAITNQKGKIEYTAECNFDDVDSNAWYYEAVAKCEEMGIVNGYGNGKFGPNDPITLNNVSRIIHRMSNLFQFGRISVGYDPYSGRDSEDANLYYIIPYFKTKSYQENEIIKATDPNKAYLIWENISSIQDDPATRELTVTALYHFYNCLLQDLNLDESEQSGKYYLQSFLFTGEIDGVVCGKKVQHSPKEMIEEMNIKRNIPQKALVEDPAIYDFDQINPYLREKIFHAYQQNLVHGDEAGNFRPKDSITRAEFCQAIFETGAVETLHYRLKEPLD